MFVGILFARGAATGLGWSTGGEHSPRARGHSRDAHDGGGAVTVWRRFTPGQTTIKHGSEGGLLFDRRPR